MGCRSDLNHLDTEGLTEKHDLVCGNAVFILVNSLFRALIENLSRGVRAAIADQEADPLAVFPETRALVSFACRMNRENIRTPSRAIANVEFPSHYR
jgi:hypothetical protein